MRRICFYATKSDILSVTDIVEQKLPLKYILSHHLVFPEYGSNIPMFEHAAEMPKLGVAAGKSSASCEKYLATERSVAVAPKTTLIGGVSETAYEIGTCAQCVSFNAGGIWKDDILLNGLIDTWSDHKTAQRLMRQFTAAIKKNFTVKIGMYWVGPQAYALLRQGMRLTINEKAAPEFDLRLPE